MPKYACNMLLYALNMLFYAQNMHKICKYIDCISQISKDVHEICLKYA